MPLATGTRQGRARRGVDPGSRFWSVCFEFCVFTLFRSESNSRVYRDRTSGVAGPKLPLLPCFSKPYGFLAGAPRASRHPPALVLHNPLPVTHAPPRRRVPRAACGLARWLVDCVWALGPLVPLSYRMLSSWHSNLTHPPAFTSVSYISPKGRSLRRPPGPAQRVWTLPRYDGSWHPPCRSGSTSTMRLT